MLSDQSLTDVAKHARVAVESYQKNYKTTISTGLSPSAPIAWASWAMRFAYHTLPGHPHKNP